jgi:hypothetical protein
MKKQKWVEENKPDVREQGTPTCWYDLLESAISEINYHEIAESYIEEALGEIEREKE